MKNDLSSYLLADEAKTVDALIAALKWDADLKSRASKRALDLIHRIRAEKLPTGQLESFLQQYSITSEEGLALMTLAEALLRIPDKETANLLIKDKMAAANWLDGLGSSKDWMVKAAGVGLLLTSKTLDSALSKMGAPVIREAMVKAMRIMGNQFVLGEDIADAMKNAKPAVQKGYRMSYDILGEGARTSKDADRYYDAYVHAAEYIGQNSKDAHSPKGARRPGISVKLSALHPRYEYAQAHQCVPVLTERLKALSHLAAKYDLTLTVDAEEVDRLETSLTIIENVMADHSLGDWEGFGLAVQAYSKRTYPLIGRLLEMAKAHQRRIQVRVVKGAYWDTEIKIAQQEGYEDYPVFTRKCNTDVSYLACARLLFENGQWFYPMLATHNAHTAASIIEMARDYPGVPYEFQRLHGMGEGLFNVMLRDEDVDACIYAPVGPHEDLLPYLVRRLLENGANTSFVNKLLNPHEPAENLVHDPVEIAQQSATRRHSKIVLPPDLYAGEKPYGRKNAKGVDLTDPATVDPLLAKIESFKKPYTAAPLIGGKLLKEGAAQNITNPGNRADIVGQVYNAGARQADDAFKVARHGFDAWSKTPADERAKALEAYADLMEEHTPELMALCVREAGKTLGDAVAEIREAVDFCRYYANRGRLDCADMGQILPGPTGEKNSLHLTGRGVFVCISPWNFPLAIFTGQIAAALMAGNAVIAKPAEQTPLIAAFAVGLMHKAGIPAEALILLPGDGAVGAALVQHKDVAGVAFTGSTEVARLINRTLAAKDGPIVPLIAETGGQNAMIMDSSALAEQVVDSALLSAFGSAGQRCSALRILCLQGDVADKVIAMIAGAMTELIVGPPGDLRTDIGPVIDDDARSNLQKHREKLNAGAKLISEISVSEDVLQKGTYFAPCAYEVTDLSLLQREVFGPILHVIRYKKDDLPRLIDGINALGYGLTMGVHSRIETFQKSVVHDLCSGNAYVNRSIIGAVVGTQPFGGQGLSGTGPKAGGPHYLARFAAEKVISIDTTAAGGNASLVSLEE